jgi:hypothetical protein
MRFRLWLLIGICFMGTPSLLVWAQEADEFPHGDLALDCGECHDPEQWMPVETPPTFRHETTGFPLRASHAKVSCRRCHRTLVFNHVGAACADCHRDPHRGELGFRCESCHEPGSWSNQREMFDAHNRTLFPLFSVHARLDCDACHLGQRPWEYKTTPATCGECHRETYDRTTEPAHAPAGFSRRCQDCHRATASSWREGVFSHPASFPLTGGHAGVSCARCHSSGIYQGLSTDCFSCHQPDYAAAANPPHNGFPTRCDGCHNINAWRPANFEHGQTDFPLTGAHRGVDCARCHEGGRYAGTPTDCFACHQDDYERTTNPGHRASGFPTRCEACHNPSGWRPATFDHRRYFPINSGNHRGAWSSCQDCHVNPSNYRVFECIFCHAHRRSEMAEEHDDEAGYQYSSPACYRCHPGGVADDARGGFRRF